VTALATRRLLAMVLVIAAVSVATFAAFELLPRGDPAERLAGREASAQQVAAIRREWGFDRDVVTQYATMMRKALAGRLISYQTGLEVHHEIWRRLGRTLWLAIGGVALACAFSLGLALMATYRPLARAIASAAAVVSVSLPTFWVGALLAFVVGYRAGLLPGGGYVPLFDDPVGWAEHMLLPWITVALSGCGAYLLVARAQLDGALSAEYTRGAIALGLPRRRVLRRALRASLAPLVALWGLDLAAVATGAAVLVESVFDLGGVGEYAADSMAALDVPAVLGVTLLSSVLIVAVNAAVDLVQFALSPERH
jgi:peptide/nickel transport system permease protein